MVYVANGVVDVRRSGRRALADDLPVATVDTRIVAQPRDSEFIEFDEVLQTSSEVKCWLVRVTVQASTRLDEDVGDVCTNDRLRPSS